MREEPDAGPVERPDARPAVVDAALDARPDAAPTCQTGFLDLCTSTPRAESLTIAGIYELDTDADPRCVTRSQSGGPDVCLLYLEAISVPGGADLRIHGSRPVALAARTSISIEGVLDISSRTTRPLRPGAGHGACAFAAAPENDINGGGGGAGGSFHGFAGRGGVGDQNGGANDDGIAAGGAPALPLPFPGRLRGGCAGQAAGSGANGAGAAGGGGASGGAAYLFAKGAITISGTLLATGAGGGGGKKGVGGGGGGGGGGSGGMVVIESETSTAIPGMVLTNGGGGGEGSVPSFDGQPGHDAFSEEAAPGGASGTVDGNGGNGATFEGAVEIRARDGRIGYYGGGGGGGGTGFIVVLGAGRQVSGVLVPPAIMP